MRIAHLYPDKMNLYGDIGNVIALKKRCEWRGIDVEVVNIVDGDLLDDEYDLYFMGGGQDGDQMSIYEDFREKKGERLKSELEQGKPMLAICGGYQLLGEYFLDAKGNKIEGLGFLPIETVAPGPELKQRAIGNIVTSLEDDEIKQHYTRLSTLVGFENHSGRTRIKPNSDKNVSILGKVLVGEGDNEDGISDGIIYKNTIGSYMHGSLLPKNPHFADYILKKALELKTSSSIELEEITDSEEVSAHNYILNRYNIK
ncbi:MAG: type 1 glutamine amidotransferase [Candidatus Dojkabacteria bacterium]